MTYEQSWQNIYKLLSLIRPIDDYSICFEFSTNFDFKILIKEVDDTDYIAEVARHKTIHNLPIASMYYNESGEDILHYSDSNGSWGINMSTLHLTKFGSKEGFSVENAQKQFQELARMAKKS